MPSKGPTFPAVRARARFIRLENTSRKLRLTTTIICSSSPSSRCTVSRFLVYLVCAPLNPLQCPTRPFSNQTWTPPLPRLASSNHPRPPHPPPSSPYPPYAFRISPKPPSLPPTFLRPSSPSLSRPLLPPSLTPRRADVASRYVYLST